MPPPSSPENFRSVEVGTTSIELLWIQDEVVTGYILDITYNGPCTPNSQTMFLDGSLRSYTITGLEEGSSYTIELSALNGAGRSEGSRLQIVTVGTGEFRIAPLSHERVCSHPSGHISYKVIT